MLAFGNIFVPLFFESSQARFCFHVSWCWNMTARITNWKQTRWILSYQSSESLRSMPMHVQHSFAKTNPSVIRQVKSSSKKTQSTYCRCSNNQWVQNIDSSHRIIFWIDIKLIKCFLQPHQTMIVIFHMHRNLSQLKTFQSWKQTQSNDICSMWDGSDHWAVSIDTLDSSHPVQVDCLSTDRCLANASEQSPILCKNINTIREEVNMMLVLTVDIFL